MNDNIIYRDHVLVAGDWHGNLPWARHIIRETGKLGIDTILHVGDFGISLHSPEFLIELVKSCVKYKVTIAVTPGNHEDSEFVKGVEAVMSLCG